MLDELVAAITKPQQHDLTGIERFITLADNLDATVLDAAIERVDTDGARDSWTARWVDARDRLRPLLERVSRTSGDAAALALTVMRYE